MMNIPANDLALATRFQSYAAASDMADKIAADDPDWEYGVQHLPFSHVYVITVFDEDGDLLGYM